MKQVLLLLAFLAAGLALLWLVTGREAAPQPTVPSTVGAASPAEPAPASAHTESEAVPAPLEGDSAAVPTRVEQASETSAAGPEPLRRQMAEVRGHVVMASTLKPVNSGEASVLFKLPGAQRDQPDTQSDDIGDVQRFAEVDGQGHFRFELPVGTYLSQVTVAPSGRIGGSPGKPKASADLARTQDVSSMDYVSTKKVLSRALGAAGVDVTVLVEQAIEFHGLVQDVVTRAPLEGVRIRIDRSRPGPEVFSRADGTFTFRGLQPKSREPRFVHADRRDYVASQVPLAPELPLKGAAPLVIDLSRGLAISGTVVDTQNHPLRGLTLRFRAVGFEQGVDLSASVYTTQTDDLGAFRYTSVPPCGSLTVEIGAQRLDGRDLLPLQRDLGPMRADRTDIRLEVETSGLLAVRAQLANGTALGPREFHVICTNSQNIEVAGSKAEALLLRVPFGVELELEAYASANDERDPRLFIRGRGNANLDGRSSQAEIRIVLGERGSFAAPPPKNEARELVLPDEAFLRATVDLQLIDVDSGAPIEAGRHVSLSSSGGSMSSNKLENGWVRVRGRPGKHVLEAEIDGGTHQSFELMIPASGYGTAEWRLKVGP